MTFCSLKNSTHAHYFKLTSFAGIHNNIIKLTSCRLQIIRYLKSCLNKSQLIIIYFGIIQSVIDFSFPIYYNLTQKQSARLKTTQRRAHNVICGPSCTNNCLPNFLDRRDTLGNKLFNNIIKHD